MFCSETANNLIFDSSTSILYERHKFPISPSIMRNFIDKKSTCYNLRGNISIKTCQYRTQALFQRKSSLEQRFRQIKKTGKALQK